MGNGDCMRPRKPKIFTTLLFTENTYIYIFTTYVNSFRLIYNTLRTTLALNKPMHSLSTSNRCPSDKTSLTVRCTQTVLLNYICILLLTLQLHVDGDTQGGPKVGKAESMQFTTECTCNKINYTYFGGPL